MNKRILIVEDDPVMGQMLDVYFCGEGYDCILVSTIQAAITTMLHHPPAVTLLDLMLPDTKGQNSCKLLRQYTQAPILMISMNQSVDERIQSLNAGADDYICKPFSMQELKLRIEAHTRRRYTSPLTTSIKVSDNYAHTTSSATSLKQFDFDKHVQLLTVDGKSIPLTSSESELLHKLMSQPGRIFTTVELIDAIKGVEPTGNERTIDVLMFRLRSKIEHDPRQPKFLKSVWSLGYRFRGE